MHPISAYYLGKMAGYFMVFWAVFQILGWISDQVVWFLETYAVYLITAAVAVLLYLAFLLVRWWQAD